MLIHGAAGAVGHWLVQMAKNKGARVHATASGRDLAAVRALGADDAIDYRTRRFEELGTFDVVFDLVGGDTQARSWATLGRGGRLVSTVSPPSEEIGRVAGAEGIFVFTPPDGAVLQWIADLVEAGQLRPLSIVAVLTLGEASRAHEMGQSGRAGGKVVLMVGNA